MGRRSRCRCRGSSSATSAAAARSPRCGRPLGRHDDGLHARWKAFRWRRARGRVDPGALLYLLRERGLSPDELDHALEHESGLLGLGGSTDPASSPDAALDLYAYRIATAVGAMAVALGGLDALAFTGGVGEGSAEVRDRVVEQLGFLGAFDVVVVPAREELVIAREVRRVLGG